MLDGVLIAPLYWQHLPSHFFPCQHFKIPSVMWNMYKVIKWLTQAKLFINSTHINLQIKSFYVTKTEKRSITKQNKFIIITNFKLSKLPQFHYIFEQNSANKENIFTCWQKRHQLLIRFHTDLFYLIMKTVLAVYRGSGLQWLTA